MTAESATPVKLYKILGANRRPCHGGQREWPEPGEWLQVAGRLIPCKNGLHLCEPRDLARWLKLDAVVWEVEAGGKQVRHEDSKTVVRRARLVREVGTLHHRLLVAWAADCAERVLPLFEARRPADTRPRDALAVVRRWMVGAASRDATASAAYAAEAAAEAAVDAAAEAAAYAAEAAAYAAEATTHTTYTAYAAAYAVAYAVAYAASAASAASAATERGERQWQGERLLVYLSGEIVIPSPGAEVPQ